LGEDDVGLTMAEITVDQIIQEKTGEVSLWLRQPDACDTPDGVDSPNQGLGSIPSSHHVQRRERHIVVVEESGTGKA
jgi:hypothetical protein